MRTAEVYYEKTLAGTLIETEEGYTFAYDRDYLAMKEPEPVSLLLPLSAEPYHSPVMFSFFDGLIPEGWMLHIAEQNWKLNERDRMGLLLNCCRDCIGAVSIRDPGQESVRSQEGAQESRP